MSINPLKGDKYAIVTESINGDLSQTKDFRKHLHAYNIKEPMRAEQSFINCTYDLFIIRAYQHNSIKKLENLLTMIQTSVNRYLSEELTKQELQAKLDCFLDTSRQDYTKISDELKVKPPIATTKFIRTDRRG